MDGGQYQGSTHMHDEHTLAQPTATPRPAAPLLELGHASILLPEVQEDGGDLDAVLGRLGQHKVEAARHRVIQLA